MLRRLEFHYLPKHASWLNIFEIEIGVVRSQCLDLIELARVEGLGQLEIIFSPQPIESPQASHGAT